MKHEFSASAMADDFEFADKVPPAFDRVVHFQILLQTFNFIIVYYLHLILIDSCAMFLLPLHINNLTYWGGSQGFNPGLIVLLVVGGLLLTFLIGNYVLYTYAQKTLPPRKKKPVSKKKMKKERLKQGVSAPGE
ncbi:unnamed protein product [Sphenostylis stenocarpa]|uniref:Uncharacterized protein n=1 Tax=Sphenostylis stenocarpa TaxID=92480 RepID=A0AA86S472_9FABA|nr:unnamed protein product [Sphenostylis stenocarpa]